jgi:hypothetical protein
MSSVWTPIDEKPLSTTIIKNETADDEENSSLSNASGTTSSSIHSRTSTRNSLHQNEQQVTIYSELPSSTTTVTNINTASSNDLQQEQYPSTNGKIY